MSLPITILLLGGEKACAEATALLHSQFSWFRVFEARDGREAEALLGEMAFDCVLVAGDPLCAPGWVAGVRAWMAGRSDLAGIPFLMHDDDSPAPR